jgi:hypothetical protein
MLFRSTSTVVVTKEKMAAVLKEEKAADSTAGNGFHKVKISGRFIEVGGLSSLDHWGICSPDISHER